MLTVIIPWRPQPSRMAAFAAVTAWYRDRAELFGGVDIRTVDSGDAPFNLARCRNVGIDGLDDPDAPVVVNDGDTIPEEKPLLAALADAASSGLVHLPYTVYRWLGPDGTAEYESGTPIDACGWTLITGACSGVYVTTPRTWRAHGGQDQRFRGWGFEDSAWYAAHTTLLGAVPPRHEGNVYALVHETQQRQGTHYEANATLMRRYTGAESDVAAMRHLVFGTGTVPAV